MMSPIYPILASALVAGTAFLGRRLNQAVQPLRLELAERGEDLLGEENLSSDTRDHINFMLETAFGMRGVMIASIFAVPVFALLVIVKPKWVASLECIPADPYAAKRFFHLSRLHDRITRANHPFLLPLVETEMAVIVTPAFVLRSVIDNSVSQAIPNASVATIEEVKAFFARGLWRKPLAVGH